MNEINFNGMHTYIMIRSISDLLRLRLRLESEVGNEHRLAWIRAIHGMVQWNLCAYMRNLDDIERLVLASSLMERSDAR